MRFSPTWILIVLVFIAPFVKAQKEYDSLYTARPGITGKAKFSYDLILGKIVREGPFSFEYENYDLNGQLLNYSYEHWKGRYEHNKKQGRWRYSFAQALIELRGVEDHVLQHELESERANLSASYELGIPQGEWDYLNTRIDENGEEEVIEDFQLGFKEGLIDGEVFVTMRDSNGKAEIYGRANHGLFDGEWTFSYGASMEYRTYKLGVLLRLIQLADNDTLLQLDFPLSPRLDSLVMAAPDVEEVLSSGRMTFRDGYDSESEYVRAQQRGNAHLKKMLGILKRQDADGEKIDFWPIATHRAIYPFTEREEEMLDELNSVLEDYLKELNSIRREEVLNLDYSQEVAIALPIAWARKERALLDTTKLSEYAGLRHRLLRTNRRGLVVDTVREIMDESGVEAAGKRYRFSYVSQKDVEYNLISYLLENFQNRTRIADSLHEAFQLKLESMNINRAIALRNDKITSMIARLDSTIKADTKDPVLNNLVEEVHDHYLKDVVEMEYQAFLGQTNDLEKQAEIGDSLLLELAAIEEIYSLVHRITERRRRIDELYTEYVFDPFTMTDEVPARVKKRLYDIVAGQIFNQLVTRATRARDPFTCEEVLRQLYDVQSLLIPLRQMDTKKLEKRLRKTKDPDERIKLLYEAAG